MGPWLTPVTLGVAAAGWLAGLAVFGRNRTAAAVPEARPRRSVSVVIPARNEAAALPKLLGSIAAQEAKPSEVIVVDDDSTDGTAAVARGLGARVIPAGTLPDGWRGKTWACHVGAAAASGESLLFLDADTWFEPGGLARLSAAHEGGALSVAPYHAVVRPYEQLSAFFNLVMAAGIGAFTLTDRPPDGLFGQMLLIDRADYERVDGHAAVRGQILENLHMAARLRDAGVPIRCLLGRGVLSVRMYPEGVGGIVRGWGKAFAGGAGRVAPVVLFGVVLWLSGAVSAAAFLVSRPSALSAAVYAAFALQFFWLLRRVGSFKPYVAAFFPVPLAFFFAVFARSALGRKRGVSWKGRVIHAA